MKILEVCAVDFTLYHFLVPLIEGFTARGHEVIGACSDGANARQVRARGVRVEPVPFSRRMGAVRQHIRAYHILCALLRKESFDIVHVHTPMAAALGRLAAWRTGVPTIVYTAHGFYFHEYMKFWNRVFFIGIEWLLGRITDVLFTQTEEDAAIARHYRLCRGGNIEAIQNGVDPECFYPSTSDVRRLETRNNNNMGPHDCVIMVVGRLVAEKGYLELFTAMKELEATLWVVGERLPSDHAKGIKKAIKEVKNDPKLVDKIRFLGERSDVPELLRAADIFVLPSHREGMPRSIIEAMMTSLPVVATNIRGSREEVIHEETGLLVPVQKPAALIDALKKLISDEVLRERMGKAGRNRALALFDEGKVIKRQIKSLGL